MRPRPLPPSSTQPPTALPAGATDCHIHVFDPRFTAAGPVPAGATAGDYRAIQQRLGLTRVVVVQPRPYGTDNRALLDAISQLGPERARGVAVLHPEVDDATLATLHTGGVRGLRFTLGKPDVAVVTPAMIAPLAHRIAPLGWHVQLHLTGAQIVELESLLWQLPVPLVFDHMGRPPRAGTAHPSHAIVCALLAAGHAWVKLSGADLIRDALDPDYERVNAIARSLVETAPERAVWGSDWPHTSAVTPPDDAALLALLSEQVPEAAWRQRILVDNPAGLYGFAS